MRNPPPFGCVLAAILLAALVYFGYQVASVYIHNLTITKLQKEIYGDALSPDPAKVDEDLAKVDAALDRQGGIELKAFKTELLLFKAWFHPEQSLQPVRQALPLGLEVYAGGDPWQEIAGWHVAWALSYAGLPVRLERWSDEVLVRAPQLRPRVMGLLIEGKVVQDDVPGAQVVIDRELSERGTSLNGRMTALSGCLLLGDYAQAAKLEPKQEELASLDTNQLLALAQLGLLTQHFAQAHEYLGRLAQSMPGDADIALLDATALAGLHGMADQQLPELFKTAATSTRAPRSVAGCEALACAQLGIATGAVQWEDELTRLAAEQPRDYTVAGAQALLLVERAALAYRLDGVVPGAVGAQRAVELARQALDLAQLPTQRQEARLLLARALAQQTLALAADGAKAREESAHCLRQALGDPAEVDAAISEALADYSDLLLDPCVQAVRAQSAEYDAAVNHAVVDYLNRRIELFNGIPQLAPLDELKYRGPAPDPAAASTAAGTAPQASGPAPEAAGATGNDTAAEH
jgi:hypothetical protein